MMSFYESVLIVKPQLSDPEIAILVDKTKKIITQEGGEILHEDKWGRRKLSYQIHHCREGFYVYMKFQAPPATPARLESHWKVQDSILRTLVVRHEERKPKAKAKPKKQ